MVDATDAGRDEEAVRRFIERFALTCRRRACPACRRGSFAAILSADDGRCTAADLAGPCGSARPRSPARSATWCSCGLVRREREPGERRDHYRISSDTWYEAATRREAMIVRWEQDLDHGIKAVGPHTPAGDRLEETRPFFAFRRA